ncbi:MAG: hypothetical protein ACHQHO_03000 [Solirubrobacterales bacterium]
MTDSPEPAPTATPQQFRDSMPLFALLGIETEIARADGAMAAKATQTQAFQYPRG